MAKSKKNSPHLVHIYRSREEYLARLKSKIAGIEITHGLYMPNERTAHFFIDNLNTVRGTLFHEATHQLFYEAGQTDRDVGLVANFWVLEGIACYMESCESTDAGLVAGNPRHIRFQNARDNFLAQKYYVPLGEFSAMGMREFQTHPKIAENYGQAAGLVHFLMHAQNGRYRDALVRLLTQLYSENPAVRENSATISELTGVDFSVLDTEYRDSILQFPQTAVAP